MKASISVGVWYHSTLAIETARHIVNQQQAQGKQQNFLMNKHSNKALTFKQAYSLLDKLEGAGFKVIPPCDNHNKEGACKGHKYVEGSDSDPFEQVKKKINKKGGE